MEGLLEGLLTFEGMKLFSIFGTIAFILAFIPNLVFAKKTHQAKVDDADTCGYAVCLIEMIASIIMGGAIIFIRMPLASYYFAIAAGVALLLCYIAWVRYYKAGAYYPDIYTLDLLGIPVPIAIFGALYYILVSIWLSNLIALCASLIYATCHIANAMAARKDMKCRL